MARISVLAALAIGLGLTVACIYGVSVESTEPPPGSYSPAMFQVATADKTMSVQGASITSDFLTATKVHPLLGRSLVSEDYQPAGTRVVMLGYDLWHRAYAGAPDIVGRTIQIDGRPVTVVGIMPKGFAVPEGAEVWVPRSQ